MLFKTNERGFVGAEFTDRYGEQCLLRESSLATESCIWLGIQKTKLIVYVDENKGQYLQVKMPDNFTVNGMMHLTQQQVKELLPHLTRFAETGSL